MIITTDAKYGQPRSFPHASSVVLWTADVHSGLLCIKKDDGKLGRKLGKNNELKERGSLIKG